MQAWQATVQDEQGNVVVNPSLTVYEADGVTLASIFDESGAPKANPFIGTLEGFVQFFAEPGDYKVVGASGAEFTQVWSVTLWGEGLPITPQKFGAAGDGVTDDTDAVEAWADAFDSARAIGPTIAAARGRYLISRPIYFTNSGGFRSVLDWEGAEFICNFNRDEYPHFLFFGNPSNLSEYQSIVDVKGRWFLRKGPLCTRPPIGLQSYGAAQSSFNGINTGPWENTVIHFHGPQNITINDIISYFGGKAWGYQNVSGSRYTWDGDLVTRVSGSDEFYPDVAGKNLALHTTINQYRLRCVERISSTQIRVDRPNTIGSTTYEHILRFGSCAVTAQADSNVISIDGQMPITNDLLGLEVCIPRLGDNGGILFARVTDIDPPNRMLTLSKPAVSTLNPILNPLTDTTEIATPVFKLTSDVKEGVYSNGISQVRFYNSQFESFDGVAIAIDDAELTDFFGCKLHGVQTGYTWVHNSIGAIWANRLGGQFYGSLDGSYYGMYRLVWCDNTHPWNIMSLSGRMGTYENISYIGPSVPGYLGARMGFNTVSMLRIEGNARFPDIVHDAHYIATGHPGYVPPINFMKGDRVVGERYLTNDSVFFHAGGFELAGNRINYNPSNGLVTLRNTRVQDANAQFDIWNTTPGGNTRLRFTDNGGNERGTIRGNSSTGVMTHSVQGVDRFSVTGRGVNLHSLPGPYETTAEAMGAGLAAGDLYYNASKQVRIV